MANDGATRGRGSGFNPPNRFERLHVEIDADAWRDAEPRPLPTEFLRDDTRSVLSANDAGDISFERSLNPYRGCEHGCAYCYARTYHEFLGFSAGLDFEAKIVVKHDAPGLLEKELSRPAYRPSTLVMSGVTDCYQPVERVLQITRRCLGVLARFRHPVVLITKNTLVTRDLDHLSELASHRAAGVYLSITTLDPALARILEPRAATPRARLDALRQLSAAGVPCGVSAAPMIPGLNDSELPAILREAAAAGASFAMCSTVRLPGAVAPVFTDWLDRHFPERKQKVLARIRDCHGGHLNSTRAGDRLRGTNEASRQLNALFHAVCRKLELATETQELNTGDFRRLLPGQGELW